MAPPAPDETVAEAERRRHYEVTADLAAKLFGPEWLTASQPATMEALAEVGPQWPAIGLGRRR